MYLHFYNIYWFCSSSRYILLLKPRILFKRNLNYHDILALRLPRFSRYTLSLNIRHLYLLLFLFIIICLAKYVRSLMRVYQSVIRVRLCSGLSLFARIVSLAKYRKNIEQKWHCVQPLDHWMLVRVSPIRRINTTLRMYQHGWFLVSARCECTFTAQTRSVLLRHFVVERDAQASRVSMPSWEHYALSEWFSRLYSLVVLYLSSNIYLGECCSKLINIQFIIKTY